MNRLHTLLRGLVLALLAALPGLPAQAGSLTVTVTDKDGQPVPDAAVLLRYPAQPANRPTAAPVVVIDQEKLRFQPYLTIVAPGTTVLFTNRDPFDHHIRASAPPGGKDFEARLAPDPTKPFGITISELGRYTLGCHLHSRMRGYILATDTPWFAKTDASGKVRLDNLPDGSVEVQLWHPEQFIDQPVQRVQLGANPATVNAPLNFSPRVRRAL